MSIVAGSLPGARILDLFAGSGALGLEALSRGAEHAVFVDAHAESLAAVQENAKMLGALAQCTLHRRDALQFVQKLVRFEYDVAFADPPYGKGLSEDVANQWLREPFARVIGVEHSATETMPDGGETRRYGDTAITFFRAVAG